MHVLAYIRQVDFYSNYRILVSVIGTAFVLFEPEKGVDAR